MRQNFIVFELSLISLLLLLLQILKKSPKPKITKTFFIIGNK